MVTMGGATAIITLSGSAVSTFMGCKPSQDPNQGPGKRWSELNPLPNADDPVKPVPGTRPELTALEDHYKVTNVSIPEAPDIDEWRLKISGLVENLIEIKMIDIQSFESLNEFITLTCISNPVGGPLTSTTRWTGVSLQRLLPGWKLKPNASHLRIFGIDGFHETVSIKTIMSDQRVMLVYEWDGIPLPIEHGYPLRIFIPNRFGMKQPKWINSIVLTDHWEPGFSVKNTWDKDAFMETTSVIDVIYADENDVKSGTVHLGGIAHAGSKGISRVEVRVDKGNWEIARLRKPLSDLSWVVWRFEWPFEEGEHEFTVRAFDKTGRMQKEEESPPYPDGATGFFTRKHTI